MKKYLTTSQFAQICSTTKHTLFHYDEIGLLKPEFVNKKGYRFTVSTNMNFSNEL